MLCFINKKAPALAGAFYLLNKINVKLTVA